MDYFFESKDLWWLAWKGRTYRDQQLSLNHSCSLTVSLYQQLQPSPSVEAPLSSCVGFFAPWS
jgi:hypothetical protein